VERPTIFLKEGPHKMKPKLPTPSKEDIYRDALCFALERLKIEHHRVRSLHRAVKELREFIASTNPATKDALDLAFRDAEIDAIWNEQRPNDLSELLDLKAQQIRQS
jgi:hypothetical protein